MYCFDPRVGHYRKLEMKELRILADQLFHNRLLSLKNPVKGYNDLASLLTCQYDLVVDDAFEAKDEYIWAFRNVLVDIASGEVWPNDGSVFLLSSLQCDYDSAAECPGFDSIISYAAMGSPEIEALLWEIIGYILSPDIKAKKFFVFSGVKNSGKTTKQRGSAVFSIKGPGASGKGGRLSQ